MNQNNMGELIKKIRKENHLTQKEFAELFGVTYQAVSKWENGQNIPDIAILKEISDKFHVDLNDLLEGKKSKRNNKKRYMLIAGCCFIVAALLLVYFLTHNHDFIFKTVRSNCDDFTVLGSMAYNDDKTAINISSISCLSEEKEKFSNISCVLYEQVDNTKIEISKDEYQGEAITLNDYLNTVEFNIDDYKSTCKYYTEDSLSIELQAENKKGQIIIYEIPLLLNDNCSVE